MVCTDQLHAPALRSAELVCRRFQLIESAHSLNPSAPDYSAADQHMGWGRRRQGMMVAPLLQQHVATALRDEHQVAKEQRKAH
eukprot:6772101-Pyramimonas_sp.AAC.1